MGFWLVCSRHRVHIRPIPSILPSCVVERSRVEGFLAVRQRHLAPSSKYSSSPINIPSRSSDFSAYGCIDRSTRGGLCRYQIDWLFMAAWRARHTLVHVHMMACFKMPTFDLADAVTWIGPSLARKGRSESVMQSWRMSRGDCGYSVSNSTVRRCGASL